MGTTERRERERLRRFNEILDAAEEVFVEKGLHNATVDDIAERAELAKGTVYLYFKCKEMFFFGLDLRGSIIQKERFEEAFAHGTDGLSKVIAIGRAYIDHALEYPLYFRSKTQTGRLDPALIASLQDDPMAEIYQTTLYANQMILIEAIKAGLRDKSIQADLDPLKTALLLWSQSNGLIEVILNRGEIIHEQQGVDLSELVEAFIQFIHRALAPA